MLLKWFYPSIFDNNYKEIKRDNRKLTDLNVITHICMILPVQLHFISGNYYIWLISNITIYYSFWYHYYHECKYTVIENILAQLTFLSYVYYSFYSIYYIQNMACATSMIILFIFTNKYKNYYNILHPLNHIIISYWCYIII